MKNEYGNIATTEASVVRCETAEEKPGSVSLNVLILTAHRAAYLSVLLCRPLGDPPKKNLPPWGKKKTFSGLAQPSGAVIPAVGPF